MENGRRRIDEKKNKTPVQLPNTSNKNGIFSSVYLQLLPDNKYVVIHFSEISRRVMFK